MERDKYLSEYTILKKEYDKLTSIFSEENDKCMRRFEENEKKYFPLIDKMKNNEEARENFLKFHFEKNI